MSATTAERAIGVRPAPRAQTSPEGVDENAWPTGLKLLVFLLVVFAVNVGLVLYLAQQMPT